MYLYFKISLCVCVWGGGGGMPWMPTVDSGLYQVEPPLGK